MERWREDLHYFSIPGGHIEPGEKPSYTVQREILEETTISVLVKRPVFLFKDQENATEHLFYLCSYITGEPHLAETSEEFQRAAAGNRFKPQWIPMDLVKDLQFGYWQAVQTSLVRAITGGFPESIEVVLSSLAR